MQKRLYLPLFSLLFSLLMLVSCEKDEGKLPAIEFKTIAGYVSTDTTVAQGDAVLVGIIAQKTEDKDVLKTFNVSASFDGGASTSLLTQSLSGSEGDLFQADMPITVRNQAGTEQYTFTVTNRDGLTNSVSLTLTVQ